MVKKNNPPSKPAHRRQIVAFSWNERKAGEITPLQYVNGEWIAEKSVPFGGTVEITLHKKLAHHTKPFCQWKCRTLSNT